MITHDLCDLSPWPRGFPVSATRYTEILRREVLRDCHNVIMSRAWYTSPAWNRQLKHLLGKRQKQAELEGREVLVKSSF